MTHEDELRSLESTLAVYKETIKEVNRLGGDGMVSVRTEWLLDHRAGAAARASQLRCAAGAAGGSVVGAGAIRGQRAGSGGRPGGLPGTR